MILKNVIHEMNDGSVSVSWSSSYSIVSIPAEADLAFYSNPSTLSYLVHFEAIH